MLPEAQMGPAGSLSLVVPTRNRLPLLLRALSSYRANAAAYGHRVDTIVVDDSADPGETRLALPACRVIGRDDRRRFAANAARAVGLDQRAIEFGLLGPPAAGLTTGAARNAALLATVGSRVVSVDDDTTCELWRPERPPEGTTLLRTHPQTVWFLPDAALPPSMLEDNADFVGAHDRMLGATARQLGVDIDDGPLGSLLDAQVVSTVAGTHGKSGMDHPPHMLLDEPSFARVASTEFTYHAARNASALVRVPAGSVVTPSPMMMSTAIGLDNRQDLPPFCPVERNQDGLYGLLLQRLFAPALFGHIPLAVRHDDGRPHPPWGDAVWRTIVPDRFSDLLRNVLMFLVATAPRESRSSLLRGIGAQLAAVGQMPARLFEEFTCQAVRLGSIRRRHALLQRIDMHASAPAPLRQDMARALGVLDAAIAAPAGHAAGGDRDVLDAWQRHVAAYGELMTVWPELRRFAGEHPDAWRADQIGAGRSGAPAAAAAAAPSAGKLECPFCGWRLARFLPHGHHHAVLAQLRVVGGGVRANAVCPMCFSMDRERLVYLYLRHHCRILQLHGRVLHIAPERRLGGWLASLPALHYIGADVAARRITCRMDVTDLPLPDRSVDAIICNHVLEHVPDDARALKEFHRVLKPSGFAVLQVPIGLALAETREDVTVDDPQERERTFGQVDHVRIYGRDYPMRLARAGFECRLYDPVADLGLDAVRRFSLIEGERLHVARKA